jgi:hypothetical protein
MLRAPMRKPDVNPTQPPIANPIARSCVAFCKGNWTRCLLLLWAIWWGGISFYSIFVIPIGTEMIGSVEQGFVTQRVAGWHNFLTSIMIVGLAIEAFRKPGRLIWSLVVTLTLADVALLLLHRELTGSMGFEEHSIPESFYARHAMYLWITALEWLAGLLAILVLSEAS